MKTVEFPSEQAYKIATKVLKSYPHNIGNLTEADDVIQDSVLKAFKYYESFDPAKSTFYTWMYRITSNQINTSLRKSINYHKQIEHSVSKYPIEDYGYPTEDQQFHFIANKYPSPEEAYLSKESSDVIRGVVESSSFPDREILYWSIVHSAPIPYEGVGLVGDSKTRVSARRVRSKVEDALRVYSA